MVYPTPPLNIELFLPLRTPISQIPLAIDLQLKYLTLRLQVLVPLLCLQWPLESSENDTHVSLPNISYINSKFANMLVDRSYLLKTNKLILSPIIDIDNDRDITTFFGPQSMINL